MVRILGVALVLAGVTLGAATVATADPVRVDGSLFADRSVCAGGQAVALVPGAYDAGTPVRLSSGTWSTLAEAGELVRVPVPAAPGTVEVKAAGFRDGLPHDRIDRLAVGEPCAN